jgi:tungstate transport system ATP-binding protein
VTDRVIRLEDILVQAGGHEILEVADFQVAKGETVALVGPNGAGKTTLLHVAALLRQPDRGSVTVLGETATPRNAPQLRRSLAVVFQSPLLFDISVVANAAAGARFHGQPAAVAHERALNWLDRFGVAHLAQRRARGLSGGEAARVALARAFVTDPAIMLLDEPFSALDAPTRASLLPALRSRLRETGSAAVLVTHDLEEAFAFADRIDLIDGGRIEASGEAADLIARPPSRRAAELLGIETILPARVIRLYSGAALVEIEPASSRLRVCIGENAHPASGQAVTVTLPASAAHILRPHEPVEAGWNALPGRVIAVTPLSSGMRLVVATPAPFVAIATWNRSGRRWSVGDSAIVAFPPESPHLILAAS